MVKRLAAAWLAWRTRRLLWLWGLAYLMLLASAFRGSGSDSQRTINAVAALDRPAIQVDRRRDLERLIAEGRGAEVESLSCAVDWSDFGPALDIQMLEPKIGKAGVDEQLQELHRRKPLPDFDRFPNLRVLDLQGCVIYFLFEFTK